MGRIYVHTEHDSYHDDDRGGGDVERDLGGIGAGKPSVTFRTWFSARTFGTLLPETETVKFINNFRLLITLFCRASIKIIIS